MTNDDMIIALRSVAEKYKGKPIATFETNINAMATDAADHIERLCDENNFLKAEIERLEEILGGTSKVLTATCAGVRAEAIKEFAERLKVKKATHYCKCGLSIDTTELINDDIDNLLKEME